MKKTCIVVWLVLVVSVGAFAQSAKRTFEVANVRASVPGTRLSQRLTPTRIDMVNTPPRSVILAAFRIDVFYSRLQFRRDQRDTGWPGAQHDDSVLALNVDRPVIDKSGLTGVYAFKVELDANQRAIRMMRSLAIGGRQAGFDEPTVVSTFAAVERLGLKLERGAPFDILVVDRIERQPTEP
jgi:hypothetical protein